MGPSKPELDALARMRVAAAVISGQQKVVANTLGISGARLSNYLTGKNRMPRDILQSLSEKSGVSFQWLDKGAGEIFGGGS